MRPAVLIVRSMATSTALRRALNSSSETVHDEERVVHREPEPDELDEVRYVKDHQELVREEEHDREGGEGRAQRRRRGVSSSAAEMPRTRASRTKAARTAMSFPPSQVGREDRGDVVLEGRGPGHIGMGSPELSSALRSRAGLRRSLLQVERRARSGIEDPATGRKSHGVACRQRREPRPQGAGRGRPACGETVPQRAGQR